MKLFKLDGYKVVISEEALTLKPFKAVWDRHEGNEKAVAELSYVYFMEDPSSDYQYLTDRAERHRAVKQAVGLTYWQPDKLVKDAMKLYASFKTTAALMLEDLRYSADRLRKSLRNVDVEQLDDKGRPVYNISAIMSAMKQMIPLAKELAEAERVVAKEMAESGRVRGQKTKTVFEDGLDL